MRTSKRRYNTTGVKSEIFEGLAETSDRRYLIIYNMDTAVARFSKNAVEYFGLKGEYDTEILDTIGPLLHKNDVESVMNLITQILTKQRDRAICDFRIRNKAGEYVACSLNGIVKGKYFLISIENHSISDNIDGTTSLYNVVEFWKYIKGLHENSESAVLLFIGICVLCSLKDNSLHPQGEYLYICHRSSLHLHSNMDALTSDLPQVQQHRMAC